MCDTYNINNAKVYRHRWESPMVVIAILASIGAIIVSIASIIVVALGGADASNEWGSFAYIILVLPIVLVLSRFYTAAQNRANDARVGPDQFPEIWAIYEELVDAIGLQYAPRLYVINGNGVTNAFALSCSSRRHYIVLHSEIATLMSSDPDIVRFVLAHELAHHKLGHVSLLRIFVGAVMNMMFLPGKALTRAQEYSADRLAMAMCPDAARTLAFLSVGPWMADRLNYDAFNQQTLDEDRSLTVRIANIASDHAVMTKRVKALNDIKIDGFARHGEMF